MVTLMSVRVRTVCCVGFLGAFAKKKKNLENRLFVSCLASRLSVREEQLGSHTTDFNESLYMSICRKSVEKIQV